MDIRDWPLNRIMQLPDCCFGRRWPVILECFRSAVGHDWDISEIAIPDLAVLWRVSLTGHLGVWDSGYFRLALGDKLPTAVVEMNALEPVISGLGVQGAEPRQIHLTTYDGQFVMEFKQLVHAQGRRPILELFNLAEGASAVRVELVFSSIPTEVPDWLISDHLRSP